jgi:hypothetical protein
VAKTGIAIERIIARLKTTDRKIPKKNCSNCSANADRRNFDIDITG